MLFVCWCVFVVIPQCVCCGSCVLMCWCWYDCWFVCIGVCWGFAGTCVELGVGMRVGLCVTCACRYERVGRNACDRHVCWHVFLRGFLFLVIFADDIVRVLVCIWYVCRHVCWCVLVGSCVLICYLSVVEITFIFCTHYDPSGIQYTKCSHAFMCFTVLCACMFYSST